MSAPIFSRILYQSRLSPVSVAVSSARRRVTYAAFVAEIEHMASYLHRHNLPVDALVAVWVADFYLHWVVVLALIRLGRNSVSISSAPHKELGARVFVTDQVAYPIVDDLWVRVSETLLTSPDGVVNLPQSAIQSRQPVRVILSSGTTGHPKKIQLDYGLLEARVRNIAYTYDISSCTRYLDAVPITAICGFHLPLATWSLGGTVVMRPQPYDKYTTLLQNQINLMFASPIVLAQLLDTIPKNAPLVADLKVFVGGSVLPHIINRQARERLTRSLYIIYGSTEASVTAYAHASIADESASASGYVLPFAEVQVVDCSGQLVADGVEGEIRIRSEGCIAGYLDDEELNARVFRGGWFHPGDIGTISSSGVLYLKGRAGHLMNLGGFKVAPDLLEQGLVECPGVAEIAVIAAEDKRGIALPWVFVRPASRFRQDALIRLYREKFPDLPPPNVVRVNQLPRNEMGKIKRQELINAALNLVSQLQDTGQNSQ